MSTSAYKIETHQGEKGSFSLFPGLCKGCGLCMQKCPKQCMSWSKSLGLYGTPAVSPNMDECIACGICESVCPDCAIKVEKNK